MHRWSKRRGDRELKKAETPLSESYINLYVSLCALDLQQSQRRQVGQETHFVNFWILSSILYYLNTLKMDSNVDPPRVTGLNVFPIKSCKAIRKTEIEFDAYGVVGDRRFMMINGNGRLLAQRQAPIMATVTANFAIEKGKRYLCARAPSMTWDLKFEPILEGPRIDATVWDSHIRVIDQGEVPAKWFNELLGCQSTHNRLVASAETSREGETYERKIWNLPSDAKNRLHAPPSNLEVVSYPAGCVEGAGHKTSLEVGLADSAPVSLVSQESLEDLNTRMAESGAYEVPLNRFRMNIEITGCSRPYEEDEWVRVCVGEVPFLIYRDSEVRIYVQHCMHVCSY